ncbi:DNA damage-inducible protein 1 [Penicillium cataractarum]|uniref:DNA damage-inducible protein 1 n=1 Tax=Penicillium cataractarum TaxID=2100454 RepID=A0A9W9V220_9EURO|nr:DNA damage-inducible protein 1 [Penicillium cataractarum]KAJ5364839.1 DNA damage-inducible protein 1 [Penicillium cataractarum]
MGSNYVRFASDIVSNTAMLSARSTSTATDGAGLSSAEKVTLYVIAAIVAVLITVGITIAVLRTQCHDGPWTAHSSGQPRQRSMTKALLKSIPLVQYDDENDALNGKARPANDSGKTTSIVETAMSMCAICTDEFVKNQLVRVLPCGHLFHQNCVDEWLVRRSRTCPTCRYELTPSGKSQTTEMAKNADDIEVGLPDVEARHTQPHGRLHRYLRSLRSTLRRDGNTSGSL